MSNDAEITLEANPTSAEANHLEAFRAAGVNRLSLGIQALDDKILVVLGRDHSAKDALRTLEKAQKLFDQVTFDLIFARPGQTLSDWRRELKEALALAGNHLSMYQLTFERGTPLFKALKNKQLAPVPDMDEAADMYDEAVKEARAQGFLHYEVSNYARSRSAMGRHNFSYWLGEDYLGIGPGAHGRLTTVNGDRLRTFGEFHPDRYMALCESEGEGIRKWIPLETGDMLKELVVFGMRTRAGVSRPGFQRMTGRSLDTLLDQDALQLYLDHGFLVDDDQGNAYLPSGLEQDVNDWYGIRPTEAGLARMDSLIPNLILHEN
ncbi:hypothetical protein BCR43DRAFT_482276 [Syncephalastrum racemosum]|uniref:Radical SAM core domain-containing protein n=1 Tax=Syncephalastrum racemosum TaxID=13706 RepID=A0A1X2HTD0_SYNRA|nr:hypothetical protein BCR43DRAFT_482276 [Syncephalastrum racemosum]